AQRAADPHGDHIAIRDVHFRRGRHRHVLSLDMGLADQLSVARVVASPYVRSLFIWNCDNPAYWATALFMAAMATDQVDGWLARRQGRTSELGALLAPMGAKTPPFSA